MEKRIKELLQKGSGEMPYSDFEEICEEFENHYIDFKSFHDFREFEAEKMNKNEFKNKIKKQTSEYVSAFANSSGGILAFGVRDKTREIEDEGVSGLLIRPNISRWLSMITASATEPPVQNFCIKVVKHQKNDNQNYYMIVVGKSEFAPHQAKDHRYYGRYDDQNFPIKDQQIRDIMNRIKIGRVRLRVFIDQILHQSNPEININIIVEIKNEVVIRNPCLILTSFDNSGLLIKPLIDIPLERKTSVRIGEQRKRYLYANIIYPGDDFQFEKTRFYIKSTNFKAIDSLEIKFVGLNCFTLCRKFKIRSDGKRDIYISEDDEEWIWMYPENGFKNPKEGIIIE